MTQIIYEDDAPIPSEASGRVRDCIERYRRFIPSWCELVQVQWYAACHENPTHVVSDVSILYQYRKATINIYSNWLQFDDRRRRAFILHEIIHIIMAPLRNFDLELTKELFGKEETGDGPRSKFIMQQQTNHNEMVVEDLTNVILNLEDAGLLDLFGVQSHQRHVSYLDLSDSPPPTA